MRLEFEHAQLTVTGTDRSVHFFSMYWNKFDAKMTKMKQNYKAIMIMNVARTLCQLILYFPGKQGFVINLTWPVLKNKQHHQLVSVDSHFSCWHFNLRLLQST